MSRVSGPVTGRGSKGWAFAAPAVDLAGLGYQQEEFFLEGEATRYGTVPGTELGWDGRWQVEPVGTSRYKTRMVVVRPADPAAFNGTVIVLWNNVSAGYENFGGGDSPELFEEGYAYAAVSAQRVGVHGRPDDPQGLRAWDPERYGSLSVPSDDYSFDIFTQAANLVAPERPREGLDPMGGLEVRRLFAEGASQSAARLATYLNAVQPITRRFDAFFLVMYFGGGTPLEVGDAVMTVQDADGDAGQPRIPEGLHLFRDDLDVPVMVLNTECEATSCYGVRQPDTDRFRYWEVAGASHVSLQAMESSAPRLERDFGFSIPLDETMQGINQVSVAPVVDAALHHLQAWVCEGTPPPVQPRIEFGGDPPEISRDAKRHRARWHQAAPGRGPGGAQQRPPEGARCLRPTGRIPRVLPGREGAPALRGRDSYLARYTAAALAAEAASVVLPRDVDPLVAEGVVKVPL